MRKNLSSKFKIAALAIAFSMPAAAETLVFDPDGTGPDAPVQVQMWDFAPGNVLAKDGVTAASNGPASPFQTFGHSALIGLFMNGSPIALPRLNVDYEITQVVRYGQTVEQTLDANSNGFSELATFRINSDPNVPNFFELWWSAKNSNALAGTGFNDSILIMRGRVVDSYSNFFVSESSVPLLGGTPQQFDQSPDGNQYPGINTLVGTGSTSPLTIHVDYFNPDFFPNLQASNVISFLIRVENFSSGLPFISTNPSQKFTDTAGGALPSMTPLIGAINGLTGPDVQFQTDFNAVMETILRSDQSCRMTGGGVTIDHQMPLDENGFPLLLTAAAGSNNDRYEFGGQIGAPSAAQPQPFGEWTHHQQSGPDGSWVFRAGTHSAPDATKILRVACADPGYCQPARPAPFKQLSWEGIGQFNNIQKMPNSWKGVVTEKVSLHWVRVHYEDLGEPGGPNGAQTKNSNCTHVIGTIVGDPSTDSAAAATCAGCPDVYQINIYKKATDPATDPSNKVLYAVGGYIDHGNIQLHPAIKP